MDAGRVRSEPNSGGREHGTLPGTDGLVLARDGRRLRLQEWGQPHGAPVFLLHGTPGSRLGPRPRPAVLYAQGIRLIAYDRPGYGDSDRLPGRRVADAAADMEDIADHLGLSTFAVVGRSGGAPHALAGAALLPDRVTRVAGLANIAPPDADGLDWYADMTPSNARTYSAARLGYAELTRSMEDALAQVDAAPTGSLPFGDTELAAADEAVIADFGIKRMLSTSFAESLRGSLTGWIDDTIAFSTPWGFDPVSIKVPTLLWHGRDDIFSPVSHTFWLSRKIKNASVLIDPGAAHFGAVNVLSRTLRWATTGGPLADEGYV